MVMANVANSVSIIRSLTFVYTHPTTLTYIYTHPTILTYIYTHPTTLTYIYTHPTTLTYIYTHPTTFTYIYTHPTTLTYIYTHPTTLTYIYTHPTTLTYIYTHPTTLTYIYTHPTTLTYIYTHPTTLTYIYTHPTTLTYIYTHPTTLTYIYTHPTTLTYIYTHTTTLTYMTTGAGERNSKTLWRHQWDQMLDGSAYTQSKWWKDTHHSSPEGIETIEEPCGLRRHHQAFCFCQKLGSLCKCNFHMRRIKSIKPYITKRISHSLVNVLVVSNLHTIGQFAWLFLHLYTYFCTYHSSSVGSAFFKS